MSPLTTKLLVNEILLSGFKAVAMTNCFSTKYNFGQTSKLKSSTIPRKITESEILAKNIYIQFVLVNYKIS